MPRTGENIYERKDGRFEGRYIMRYDENGKAKYASVYGRSKAEVREKLREKKNETGSVSFDRGRTVREVAKDWLVSGRWMCRRRSWNICAGFIKKAASC